MTKLSVRRSVTYCKESPVFSAFAVKFAQHYCICLVCVCALGPLWPRQVCCYPGSCCNGKVVSSPAAAVAAAVAAGTRGKRAPAAAASVASPTASVPPAASSCTPIQKKKNQRSQLFKTALPTHK